MRKLIIIRGNSGSGKTTLAKELQKAFGPNTLVISQDTIRREMLRVHDGNGSETIKLLKTLIEYGHSNNKVTILEGILNSKWYQSLFEKAEELYGPENIFAYYYELPFEETFKRHLTKAERNDFGERELKRWWNERDYIECIKEEVITKEIEIEEAVKMIVAKMN
ncbi:AAA family ATPase [Facklamia miroungae]|uniref:AAA domain-containing protein n=1 Tax=Facklamia miroungae TaxID=120956 RepID=A0A1G7Q8T9_9LACT|nr:AAA family ATPase [Facklamia miroungae]NKZ28862.1 kinase [Facklamia miroungae]SDF94942.1 AAA domain-containing protein [Facklamia miroungae]